MASAPAACRHRRLVWRRLVERGQSQFGQKIQHRASFPECRAERHSAWQRQQFCRTGLPQYHPAEQPHSRHTATEYFPDRQCVAVLAWPTPANGYYLQQIGNLAKTNWTTAPNAVNLVGNQNQAAVPISGSNGFFRLYP